MTRDPSPPAGGPGPPRDRRRWRRQRAGTIRVERIADGERRAWQVAVRNVSPGGVRLVLGNGLPPGTALRLRLSRPGRDIAVVVSARVVYVLEKPAGCFITGCAFEQPLHDDQFRGLM